MSDKIEIGDTVTVEFATHPPITGIVKYMPQDTGDSWRIVVPNTEWSEGAVYYVQSFDFMRKVKP